MAATLTGTVGIHGIASNETGLIIEGLDDTSKKQTNWMKDKSGERVGRADYDESIEIELTGCITATSGWSQKLSAVWSLTNTISAAHLNAITTGKTLIDEVKRSRKNEEWNKITVTGEMLPFFPNS